MHLGIAPRLKKTGFRSLTLGVSLESFDLDDKINVET
jgi:hypothetical protein